MNPLTKVAIVQFLAPVVAVWLTIKFGTPQPAWAKRLEAQQKTTLEAIMATKQDLDAGITQLTADDQAVIVAVTDAGTATSKSLQDLLSKIESNPTAPIADFSDEVAALAQSHTDFLTAISSLQAITAAATQDDPGDGTTTGTTGTTGDGTTAGDGTTTGTGDTVETIPGGPVVE